MARVKNWPLRTVGAVLEALPLSVAMTEASLIGACPTISCRFCRLLGDGPVQLMGDAA